MFEDGTSWSSGEVHPARTFAPSLERRMRIATCSLKLLNLSPKPTFPKRFQKGVRGIVVGDIRRVVAKTMAKQFITRFETATKPFQHVLATRAGCGEHRTRRASCHTQRPQSRSPEDDTLPKRGLVHQIPQGEGGKQRDPSMPALFALGQQALGSNSGIIAAIRDVDGFLRGCVVNSRWRTTPGFQVNQARLKCGTGAEKGLLIANICCTELMAHRTMCGEEDSPVTGNGSQFLALPWEGSWPRSRNTQPS